MKNANKDADPVEFLKEILRIYSPSGNEGPLVNYLFSKFQEWSFHSTLDDVGNVVAIKGTGKPVLLFSSHLDTVPGEIKVEEKDGKIYGRGAVDDKGTTAAMIMAFRQSKIEKGTLIYIGVVSEETSLKGIEQVIKDHDKYGFEEAIFGEPSLHDRISIAYKGRLLLEFQIGTKEGPTHVAASWLHANPIEVAFNFHEKLKKTCLEFGGKTPFSKTIPNITMINAGEISNSLPAKCNFQIDIRFPPSIKSSEILTRINDMVEQLKKNDNLIVDYKISSQIEGYQIESGAKILRVMKKAIFKKTGRRAIPIKKTGTTFMNNLGTKLKIPVLSYGPGDPKKEHTNDEYIEIQDYLKAIEVLKQVIELYFN
ncbi:MAG: M20/M25/M40 family metallo-hydrolase [Candidatus Helarchaeales archaeon]